MDKAAGVVIVEIYCETCKELMARWGETSFDNKIKLGIENSGKLIEPCSCFEEKE